MKVRVFDYVLLVIMLVLIYLSLFQPIVWCVRDIQIQESYQKMTDPATGIEQIIKQRVIIKKIPQQGMGHLTLK